jgi:hypothetical protein
VIADHDLKKAICPDCKTEVRVDVLHEEKTAWSDDNVGGSDRYWILRCRGCDKVFFGHGQIFSEDTDEVFDPETRQWFWAAVERYTYYPRALKRRHPVWFEWSFQMKWDAISHILVEIYTALDHGLLILGATGIRTAFDSVSKQLKVDPALSFQDKIEKLRSGQHITGRERDYLQLLVDAGSAAAHSGWRPSAEQITVLMDILEGLIHRSLILPEKAEELKASLESKNDMPKLSKADDF